MSVEEMISILSDSQAEPGNVYEMFEEVILAKHTADAIIDALKAAQDMHKGYTILEQQARQCGFVDSREHEVLLKAWDAVTKEYI